MSKIYKNIQNTGKLYLKIFFGRFVWLSGHPPQPLVPLQLWAFTLLRLDEELPQTNIYKSYLRSDSIHNLISFSLGKTLHKIKCCMIQWVLNQILRVDLSLIDTKGGCGTIQIIQTSEPAKWQPEVSVAGVQQPVSLEVTQPALVIPRPRSSPKGTWRISCPALGRPSTTFRPSLQIAERHGSRGSAGGWWCWWGATKQRCWKRGVCPG